MSEWKELKIDDLPPDILTGDYEFECFQTTGNWMEFPWLTNPEGRIDMLKQHNSNGVKYRYRKPEPKAPSHEEIMTLWWFNGNRSDKIWQKVISYSPEDSNGNPRYHIMKLWRKKEWFTDKESATIPPETE